MRTPAVELSDRQFLRGAVTIVAATVVVLCATAGGACGASVTSQWMDAPAPSDQRAEPADLTNWGIYHLQMGRGMADLIWSAADAGLRCCAVNANGNDRLASVPFWCLVAQQQWDDARAAATKQVEVWAAALPARASGPMFGPASTIAASDSEGRLHAALIDWAAGRGIRRDDGGAIGGAGTQTPMSTMSRLWDAVSGSESADELFKTATGFEQACATYEKAGDFAERWDWGGVETWLVGYAAHTRLAYEYGRAGMQRADEPEYRSLSAVVAALAACDLGWLDSADELLPAIEHKSHALYRGIIEVALACRRSEDGNECPQLVRRFADQNWKELTAENNRYALREFGRVCILFAPELSVTRRILEFADYDHPEIAAVAGLFFVSHGDHEEAVTLLRDAAAHGHQPDLAFAHIAPDIFGVYCRALSASNTHPRWQDLYTGLVSSTSEWPVLSPFRELVRSVLYTYLDESETPQ